MDGRLRAALAIATLTYGLVANASDPRRDFVMHCMGCHGMEGDGVPGKIPSLRESMPAFVRTRAGRDFLLSVPGASNSSLTDAELAAVMNWLIGRFDPANPSMVGAPFTEAEVRAVRRPPQSKVRENRARLLKSLDGTGPLPPAEY